MKKRNSAQCNSCVLSWIIEQAQQQLQNPVPKIRCPSHKCAVTQGMDDVFMKVIAKYQGDKAQPRTFEVETFDQVVVKHYL